MREASGSAAPALGVPEQSPVSSAFNGTICVLGSSNGGVTMSPWHHRDKSCRRGQHPTSLCLTDGHLFHALRFTALPEAMIRFAFFFLLLLFISRHGRSDTSGPEGRRGPSVVDTRVTADLPMSGYSVRRPFNKAGRDTV